MRVEDNTQHLFSLAGSRRKLLKDLMKYDLVWKKRSEDFHLWRYIPYVRIYMYVCVLYDGALFVCS